MNVARAARVPYVISALYIVIGALMAAFEIKPLAYCFGITAGFLIAVAALIQIITNHHERKTNGRYRKAPEAHRAGAGGSAGDGSSTRARRGALGTGARMSSGGIFGSAYSGYRDELIRKMLASSVSAGGALRGQSFGDSSVQPTPPARPAGEFDGRQADFAAGVVTGTRSFGVDNLGRLLGVAYATVWTPGENVAKCMERESFDRFFYGSPAQVELREAQRPPHSMTVCAHGFYGYYEGSNDYYEAGRVMGVVEGYGETVIGSRGFRAAKARIVALHIPADVSVPRRRLLARNYPELPTFDSFDAMVAEFPPDDAGHGITPDNDPDFWTRKA